uniref:Cell death-inducing p53-target protein 1 n=1 Tax=Bubo bubo TaxID=30461 RepID=A0A8C0F6Q8_BUBBB
VGQPQGVPIPPPEFGPPPYEPPSQPGFMPPHMPTDTSGPYVPPGHYPSPGGHTATVLVPSGAATTVTVLQGEIFQGAPVQTVCPHCQQAITTKITYEIGLMSFLLGFFCCFVG